MITPRLAAGSLLLAATCLALPASAETLRLAIMGEPASLDPHKISGT